MSVPSDYLGNNPPQYTYRRKKRKKAAKRKKSSAGSRQRLAGSGQKSRAGIADLSHDLLLRFLAKIKDSLVLKTKPKRGQGKKQRRSKTFQGKKRAGNKRASGRKIKAAVKKKAVKKKKPPVTRRVSVQAQGRTKPQKKQKSSEAGQKYVGSVTHFFSKIKVTAIAVDSASFKIGDELIFIKDGQSTIRLKVQSIQYHRKDIKIARIGQEVGLKTAKVIAPGAEVYKAL